MKVRYCECDEKVLITATNGCVVILFEPEENSRAHQALRQFIRDSNFTVANLEVLPMHTEGEAS